MGKIVSVYEHFGLQTTFRKELSSWTEVWPYTVVEHHMVSNIPQKRHCTIWLSHRPRWHFLPIISTILYILIFYLSFHLRIYWMHKKRTKEAVTILCKKWDLISCKCNLYILFKNVLMLTWRWPREVKTRSYIVLLKFCCVWWSFVYSFFIVPCTTGCITLK